jgi:hypothetical protein
MQATVFAIKDTKNAEFQMVHFVPTRDEANVVHFHKPMVILRKIAEAINLEAGNVVEL